MRYEQQKSDTVQIVMRGLWSTTGGYERGNMLMNSARSYVTRLRTPFELRQQKRCSTASCVRGVCCGSLAISRSSSSVSFGSRHGDRLWSGEDIVGILDQSLPEE